MTGSTQFQGGFSFGCFAGTSSPGSCRPRVQRAMSGRGTASLVTTVARLRAFWPDVSPHSFPKLTHDELLAAHPKGAVAGSLRSWPCRQKISGSGRPQQFVAQGRTRRGPVRPRLMDVDVFTAFSGDPRENWPHVTTTAGNRVVASSPPQHERHQLWKTQIPPI